MSKVESVQKEPGELSDDELENVVGGVLIGGDVPEDKDNIPEGVREMQEDIHNRLHPNLGGFK